MNQSVISAMVFSCLVLVTHTAHASELSPSFKDSCGKYFRMLDARGYVEEVWIKWFRLGTRDTQFFEKETSGNLLAILYRKELLEFLSQWGNVGKNKKLLLTNTPEAN